MSDSHKIAVIAGDGIGKEVMPEGLRVLEAVASRHNIRFDWDVLDWSSDYYAQHGRMMPVDWKERSEEHTSELQSLMRNSYAVFCLKKKRRNSYNTMYNDSVHYPLIQ